MQTGVRSCRSRPLASLAFAGLWLVLYGAVPAFPQAPGMQPGFRPPPPTDEEIERQRRWDAVPVLRVEARPPLVSGWELRRLMEFPLGALVTPEQAQRSVQNLLATDRFAFVEVVREPKPGGDALIFLLEPQPYVRKIKIRGNDSVSSRRIREWLPVRFYARLDQALVERAVEVLGDRYEQAGFPRPHVLVTQEPVGRDGGQRLVIALTEAKLPRLKRNIRIENKPPALQLHERIWLWRKNRGDHLWSPPQLNRVHLQAHVDRALRYLKSAGFIEARGELVLGGLPGALTAAVQLEAGKRVILKVDGAGSKHRKALWKMFWKDGYTMGERDLARYVQNAQSALVDLGFQGGKVVLEQTETYKSKRLEVHIQGGAPTVVREIRFEGNRALSSGTLAAAMLTSVKSWVPFVGAPYLPKLLDEDREALAAVYALRGYPEPRFEPQVEVDPNGDTRILIRVTEGIHRVFGRIQFEGATAFTEPELLALAQKHGLVPGADLSKSVLGSFAQALNLLYVYRGFPDVRLRVQALRTRGEANDLGIEVIEGERQVMGKLIAAGNFKTRTRTLIGGFGWTEGRPLSPIRNGRLRERLSDLGILDSVLIETQPPGQDGRTNVVARVQERRSGTFDLSLLRDSGLDSGASVGAEVSVAHENLFGRGIGASVEASAQVDEGDPASVQRIRLAASLRKTSFFGIILPASIFADYLEDKTIPDYEEFRTRVATSVSKSFLAKRLQLSTTVSLEDNRIERTDGGTGTDPVPETSRIFAISPRAVYEGRNDFANPTRGTLASLGVKLAPPLGAQPDFVRFDADLRHYIPLGRKATVALALRGGLATSLSSDEILISERFFIGGETSNRAFANRELGPRDAGGVLLGGDSFLLANAELRFPLIGEIYGGLFADVGNAYGHGESFGLRPGFGLGLRYYTIIGPIRADMGWNPATRGYASPTEEQPDRILTEDRFQLHLAIGHAF